jgi:adenine-specific DNA methylase
MNCAKKEHFQLINKRQLIIMTHFHKEKLKELGKIKK